ncbi:ATP-dependent Clp protease adapter protein ClpS [Vibrio algivorus]|uniref:ATP-dependent Clp protease adapter protein ClpS n=2 Tax=Vibrio algivorus TaxID=1667024 RepID=A0ABQ6EMY3_9VIBR|nr:ATP-dependent Clp protease adapter protein ClpS [Vibrio algivorus]
MIGLFSINVGHKVELNMNKQYQWTSPDIDLLEDEKTKLKPPAMYHVILNNDDYTPMDFVIEILSRFFSMDLESATQVMLKVHFEGKASCGTFTAEVAETKVMQVTMYARENEHPLLCTMEQV